MGGSDDRALSFAYLAILLVFIASALFARRIAWRKALGMAAAWAVVFGILFVLGVFRHDLRDGWARIKAAVDPTGGIVEGDEIRVEMAEDGHFWVRGSVNGEAADFLVDSGATEIALSRGLAERAGIDAAGGRPAIVSTANGEIAVRRVVIDELRIGPIRREGLRAAVAPEFGDVNILGMNFLSSLRGWQVEGRWLVLCT